MPECGPLYYLWEYLIESGCLTTWQEINEWQKATGITLESWEAKLMFEMSNAYKHQQHLSQEMNCECPWKEIDNG